MLTKPRPIPARFVSLPWFVLSMHEECVLDPYGVTNNRRRSPCSSSHCGNDCSQAGHNLLENSSSTFISCGETIVDHRNSKAILNSGVTHWCRYGERFTQRKISSYPHSLRQILRATILEPQITRWLSPKTCADGGMLQPTAYHGADDAQNTMLTNDLEGSKTSVVPLILGVRVKRRRAGKESPWRGHRSTQAPQNLFYAATNPMNVVQGLSGNLTTEPD